MNNRTSSIEPLEARIAPAAVITYTDIDGDIVKITASKGPLDLGDLTLSDGATGQLQKLDLAAPGFRGANITFSVTKSATGDGLGHVGGIDATGVDLGKVTVRGDLGAIDAGDSNTRTPGLRSLSVDSMGRFGLATQGGQGDLISHITGRLGRLNIAGDMADSYISVAGTGEFGLDGGADATLGPVKIGGSIINESTVFKAGFSSTGRMGSVAVAGSFSGDITTYDAIRSLRVGGDVYGSLYGVERLGNVRIGGSLFGSLQTSGSIGVVRVAQNIQGEYGSANISAQDRIAGVVVGGSLFGGGIQSVDGGDIGFVRVGGDIEGDSAIFADGKLGSVTVRGSLREGSSIASNGEIRAVKIGIDVDEASISGERLDKVAIGGSVISALISSRGDIARVTIGGSLLDSDVSSDGDMGLVTIGHDIDERYSPATGSHSGNISAGGKMAGVRIGGSLIGGSTGGGGSIQSGGDMGPIVIGHDFVGGRDGIAGWINAGGRLASVTIGGSFIGGSNDPGEDGPGGFIISSSGIGAVKIGGDLRAGGGAVDEELLQSAFSIISRGRIGSLHVGGSIMTGQDGGPYGSYIEADAGIGSITVGGSIAGNANSPIRITAYGDASDGVIGKISVGGRVESASILAYTFGRAANIGPVSVGGDWIASNLVAGATNLGTDDVPFGIDAAADDVNFGDNHDRSTVAAGSRDLATIARITIGGQVLGTPAFISATDHFGFVAEKIGSLRIGGKAIALTAGPHQDDIALGHSGDVRLHEV